MADTHPLALMLLKWTKWNPQGRTTHTHTHFEEFISATLAFLTMGTQDTHTHIWDVAKTRSVTPTDRNTYAHSERYSGSYFWQQLCRPSYFHWWHKRMPGNDTMKSGWTNTQTLAPTAAFVATIPACFRIHLLLISAPHARQSVEFTSRRPTQGGFCSQPVSHHILD